MRYIHNTALTPNLGKIPIKYPYRSCCMISQKCSPTLAGRWACTWGSHCWEWPTTWLTKSGRGSSIESRLQEEWDIPILCIKSMPFQIILWLCYNFSTVDIGYCDYRLSITNHQLIIQGDSSALRPGLGWLWFGCSTIMPSHFCQIPISPSSIGQTVEHPKSKSNQPRS